MYSKGDRVKLNEYGLNCIYPSWGPNTYRDMAASKVFIVLGHSRDKNSTRVMVEGGNSNSLHSYGNVFLEFADKGKLREGQVVMIYEDPLTETKPEGKAELISPIERFINEPLERWRVEFLDDDFHNPVERLIKVEGGKWTL